MNRDLIGKSAVNRTFSDSTSSRQAAYTTVRAFLLRVRSSIERRQIARPQEMKAKLKECDAALAALEELRKPVVVEQATIFAKPKDK